jgi:hypothetical protein
MTWTDSIDEMVKLVYYIWRLEARFRRLDPNSPAYKDASVKLDVCKRNFKRALWKMVLERTYGRLHDPDCAPSTFAWPGNRVAGLGHCCGPTKQADDTRLITWSFRSHRVDEPAFELYRQGRNGLVPIGHIFVDVGDRDGEPVTTFSYYYLKPGQGTNLKPFGPYPDDSTNAEALRLMYQPVVELNEWFRPTANDLGPVIEHCSGILKPTAELEEPESLFEEDPYDSEGSLDDWKKNVGIPLRWESDRAEHEQRELDNPELFNGAEQEPTPEGDPYTEQEPTQEGDDEDSECSQESTQEGDMHTDGDDEGDMNSEPYSDSESQVSSLDSDWDMEKSDGSICSVESDDDQAEQEPIDTSD